MPVGTLVPSRLHGLGSAVTAFLLILLRLFQTQLATAGMHPLEGWSEGLCFSCFLLLWEHRASSLHGKMWAPQIKQEEKKEPRAAWGTYRVYQHVQHVSERKVIT